MALSTYTVEYSTDGTNWTLLTDVQSMNAFIGKRSFIDQITPSTLTFSMRYPNGYWTPNTALVSGTRVRVKRTGAAYTMWFGRIANVEVSYGIPYNSTTHVGPQDYVTIMCEGALAQAGRMAGNGTAIAEANAYYALAAVNAASGLGLTTTYSSTSSPLVSPSTVSGTYADWLNTFAVTLSATVKDGGGAIGVYTKDFIGTLPVSFSDTANDATRQVYEQMALTSESENYFTQVVVQTSAYGNVTATKAGATAPYRTLTLSTFSGSAAQATDLANYYLALYQTPVLGIKEIVSQSESQNTWGLDLGYGWWDILGYRTNVTFRGTTYYMSIIGSSFTATPAGSKFTYYLASAAYLPFFILNNAQYGVLGTNRLSW